MRKLLPVGVICLTVVLGAVYLIERRAGGSGLEPGVTAMDRPLPLLRGPTLDGGTADTRDLRGRVAVVNVWAEWCGPCLEEMPALQRLYERYGDRGVAFLGINYRNDEDKARALVETTGVTYPSLVDHAGAWADDLGFVGLPDTYVVDRGAPSGTRSSVERTRSSWPACSTSSSRRVLGRDRVEGHCAEHQRREVHDRVRL
ncbi:MAG: TlpA disulfide reductase family protein [Actinomycetota bacterium]